MSVCAQRIVYTFHGSLVVGSCVQGSRCRLGGLSLGSNFNIFLVMCIDWLDGSSIKGWSTISFCNLNPFITSLEIMTICMSYIFILFLLLNTLQMNKRRQGGDG